MKWFTGTIRDAIDLAKITDAIFVVYVHDSSEASTSTDETLADENLSSILSSKKFVAITLENGSESAKQFAQIYPVVVLPSLYFISGSTGIPLEILGGPLTKEKLKEKLDQFTKVGKEMPVEAASNTVPEQSSNASPEEMEVEEEVVKAPAPSEAPMPLVADAPLASSLTTADIAACAEAAKSSSSTAETSSTIPNEEEETVESMLAAEDKRGENADVPIEVRIERAKILLAEKQAKKVAEKADDEKRIEIERRKMGQEIAKRKRQQYEEEVHSAARERKKEKDEDRAARERVRAQIAADRIERERRAALLQGEAPPPQEAPANGPPPAAAAAGNSSVTRLKFRLPDGSSSIAQFPAEATLSEVRRHVEQQLVSSSTFMLTSTVHPKPFTTEDASLSLLELGLVPSAIIVVLLSSRTSGASSVVPSTGGIMQFIWLLLSPITFLLGFVRQLFGGGSTSSSRSASSTNSFSSPREARPGTSAQSTQHRPTSSYGRARERKWQRDGNIHRLHGSDDDEDNNTWNGNSTQQM